MPCVPVLDAVMNALTILLGSAGRPQIGRQHVMDAGYFSRIEAMDFAMRHDDGQCMEQLEAADVVLVGVSRTSKTPTCVYLANRGLKVANVPIVLDATRLETLEHIERPLVVGLTISPDALVHIREARQQMLGLEPADGGRFGGDYADLQRIRSELIAARRLYTRMGWPEIDVTKRSVEETAATILQMLQLRRHPELRGMDAPAGLAHRAGPSEARSRLRAELSLPDALGPVGEAHIGAEPLTEEGIGLEQRHGLLAGRQIDDPHAARLRPVRRGAQGSRAEDLVGHASHIGEVAIGMGGTQPRPRGLVVERHHPGHALLLLDRRHHADDRAPAIGLSRSTGAARLSSAGRLEV